MKIGDGTIATVFLAISSLLAQSNASPQKDSATFDADGTAHITRVVPMPSTLSPEAQAWLASLTHSTPGPETLAERRSRTDAWRAQDSAEARKLYPVTVASSVRGGAACVLVSLPTAGNERGVGVDGEVPGRESGTVEKLGRQTPRYLATCRRYQPNHSFASSGAMPDRILSWYRARMSQFSRGATALVTPDLEIISRT
jgi:hypothetical protein